MDDSGSSSKAAASSVATAACSASGVSLGGGLLLFVDFQQRVGFEHAADFQLQLQAVQLQQADRLQQLRREVELLAKLGTDRRFHGGPCADGNPAVPATWLHCRAGDGIRIGGFPHLIGVSPTCVSVFPLHATAGGARPAARAGDRAGRQQDVVPGGGAGTISRVPVAPDAGKPASGLGRRCHRPDQSSSAR
jgi:hypothetical protein